jgi:putative SOS response-associated peptidase YedK
MCGRYTLKRRDRIALYGSDTFGAEFEEINEHGPSMPARFNACPSQLLPIISLNQDGKAVGKTMKWGLIPFWEKSDKPKIAPINAKSEEITSKPMFRQSLQKRRCLVLADGFFEWKRISDDVKQPFHIQLWEGQPFVIAGIYENGNDDRPDSFALLTTKPNELMESIHNRMPAILSNEAAKKWLTNEPIGIEEVNTLCAPYPAKLMEAWPVSRLVNSPRNDVPECVARVESLI